MDIIQHNRRAWDRESSEGSEWTVPVDAEAVARARQGDWSVILTPKRPVPADWLGEMQGQEVLCLASGGGQQAPILAAAGARVVSFDLSDEQLAKDRRVAQREGLEVQCIQGEMTDLSAFGERRFDLIFHPISNAFIPHLSGLWSECYRVLKPGGALLAGFMHPSFYLFDHEEAERTGTLTVRYSLPYADPDSLSSEEKRRWLESGRAAEFSHSLEAQIGGQLTAGFVITGLYEDSWDDEATPLNRFAPVAIATRAVKAKA
ncbi:MAG: class I SAM-dependent methyltransferase [Acidobacteriota bacterium]